MKLVPEAIFDQHIIVLGKTRSGKSSAMRLLVEHLLDEEKPVCIIDPKGDWWGLKASADGKHAGYPVVIFGGDHGDVPLNAQSGKALGELLATGNRSAIIDLGGWMPGDRTQIWIDFASTYFRMHKGRHYLVVDEVHNVAPKGKVLSPAAGLALHWSNRLASEGLGKGISMLAASQRPQKVHNDFLTSCETLLAMRVIHKSDRDATKDWLQACSDVDGSEILSSLATLKRGEAWAYSPEYNFGPKRVQFPMFKTYDSFKPQNVHVPAKLKGWADVDLAEVTKKLELAVKEAEAKDPKKLQGRIRELESQLAKASVNKMLPAGNKMLSAPKVMKVKVTAAEIKAVLLKELEPWREFATESRAQLVEARKLMEKIADWNKGGAERLAEYLKDHKLPDYPGLATDFKGIKERLTAATPAPLARPVRALAAPPPPRAASLTGIAQSGENDDLGGPERKILTALSELRSIGKDIAPKAMAAAWSGYSAIGGAFGNPVGKLRRLGYVDYPQPNTVQITQSGLDLIGELPAPGKEELEARILRSCDGPERRILTALLRHGNEMISKEELAPLAGYNSHIGGAFGNPLGALRTKGLVDYPKPKFAKASDWLFEHGM